MLSRRPLHSVSHVKGDSTSPLRDLTIPQQLRQTADQFPNEAALVFPGRDIRWTWEELARRVDAFAAGLLAIGLRPGDRVGVWGPNSPEWLLTQFATARLGLILVTINPAYRTPELEYALSIVQCRALVTASTFRSSNYVDMLRAVAPELVDSGKSTRLPHLEFVISMDQAGPAWMSTMDAVLELGSSLNVSDLDAVTRTIHQDDAANIQFTSGTTGSPKGATLTHRNIVNNAHFVVSNLNLACNDRLCIPVPLYHCFGMVMGALGCATVGACMVFPSEWFDAFETLVTLSAERCTAVYGVPSMFAQILDHPRFDSFSLSSLRTGIMAGAPCPPALMERAINKMNLTEVTICYGMTETSPVSFQTAVDDPFDRKVSTIGKVHPHVEVKILDADGKTVALGETGEICCRGYSVMLGYWGDAARTAEAIVDGWMHTGDLGTLDAEGYARIVGRAKDMVIRGGENVYPREVEEFLLTLPQIRDVQVFGVPDDKLGEELCAWIVCKVGCELTEDAVRDHCRNRIAHFKIPKHIRFKTDLPITATGKPQKFKMREEMISELNALR